MCHEFLLYDDCRVAGKNPIRLLYVQHQLACTLAYRSQKPLYRQRCTQRGVSQQQSDVSQRHRRQYHFDPAYLPGFLNLGRVIQHHFNCRQACRGIAQGLDLEGSSSQNEPIHEWTWDTSPIYSASAVVVGAGAGAGADVVASAPALRASSRSTDFIMTDGAV